ncbi:hypothetical protein BDK51DRAFT_37278 [Blyttiomyces helicus]|uniref:Cns1/TTC4 wheel domain-containing protein n=1 Tax=Blyttiomyces helicus TaxID=388810 RepID=A0A4P9VW52_9FUNG|nr:hypothetical protein BDK51DRAFT_37278 [Blyttiomyces helicus]|eukprot:RKO83911.1 hypothetical protein BDK51DRAFT_37278 [Blyttiomyces helicus]
MINSASPPKPEDLDSDNEDAQPPAPHPRVHPDHPPTLDPETNRLTWPVLLAYPEYNQTDLIAAFHEDSTFADQLDVVFEHPPEWDARGEYRDAAALDVYFEAETDDGIGKRLMRIGRELTLGEVVADLAYRIVDGVAVFLVVPRGTEFAKKFKRRYKAAKK